MKSTTHTIYLCRHGDTAYSPVRRLAGRTDLDLTEAGVVTAQKLGKALAGVTFDRAWTSPLLRARRTAELAGFGDRAVIDDRIAEMSFGEYEGQMVADLRVARPGWSYLVDGCPGGEGPADLAARCDAFLADVAGLEGTSVLFAHSVILRVLTARYLGLPPGNARNFMLAPGSISTLGYDPHEAALAIMSWNDRAHLAQ